MDYLAGPLLAFLGISALVIITPGPDTAVTIRNTLLGGRPAGLATAAGVAIGQAIWSLATSAGIVALLVASEPLFLAVKYAGAAYLIWLGLLSLRTALRPGAGQPAMSRTMTSLRPRAAFGQGLLSDLGNPKMAAFFTSLLPQFVPADDPSFARLIALGLLFSAMTLLWLAGYALAIARFGHFLRGGRLRRLLDGLTGAALIALGLRLATEDR
jgi:threonine/homoserine/homoserine lactone efflux protein